MYGSQIVGQSRVRARDLDRVDACAVIDTALTDGQITSAEHATRTSTAMTADTLGDLDRLIGDLQRSAPPNSAVRLRRIGRIWYVAAASVIAAAAIGVGTVSAGNRGAETVAHEVAVVPLPPIVSSTLDTATAAGIEAFIERYREKFGDTVADSVDFYDEHASVTRAVADAPKMKQEYTFRGGFEPTEPSPRDLATATVDLASIDVDKLAGYLAGLAATLNLPDAQVSQLSVTADDSGPRIAVYASNRLGGSGWIALTTDGRPISVHRANS